jgi:hypothetical protein
MKIWLQMQLMRVLVFYYAWRNARIERLNAEIKRRHKCVWRCYRDGGGGSMVTPRPMTEEKAVEWVSEVAGAEVFHVDFDHRMIFYRSRPG